MLARVTRWHHRLKVHSCPHARSNGKSIRLLQVGTMSKTRPAIKTLFFCLQVIGLLWCIAGSLLSRQYPTLAGFLVLLSAHMIYRHVGIRSDPKPFRELTSIDTEQSSVADSKSELLRESIREKIAIVPILSEQLRAVISQTDEAAEGLISAFMTISMQAKSQLKGVEDLFGSLTERRSGSNALIEAQERIGVVRENFEQLTTFFDASTKDVSGMADQIGRINVFVQNIDRVGSTTRILAINAAIEAANAGSAGNGFKVIAAEIGVLARDSASSIREMQGIITELMTSVEAVRQRLLSAARDVHTLRDHTDEMLSATASALGRTLEDAAQHVHVLASNANALSKEISNAVMAIQFQDITRQRIEHVIEPLQELSDDVNRLSGEGLCGIPVSSDNLTPQVSSSLAQHYTMESERKVARKHGCRT